MFRPRTLHEIPSDWSNRLQVLENRTRICCRCENVASSDRLLVQGSRDDRTLICETCIDELSTDVQPPTNPTQCHTEEPSCGFCLGSFDDIDIVYSNSSIAICRSCLVICRNLIKSKRKSKQLSEVARILYLESTFNNIVAKHTNTLLFHRIDHLAFSRAKNQSKFKSKWEDLFTISELEQRLELLEEILN